MTLYDLGTVAEREIMPGFFGRLIHTERMTLALWRVEAGTELREHAHPHEQVSHVLEGSFELVVEGTPHTLTSGGVLVIAPHARHAGRALTACRILDLWSPPRDDYR